MTGGEVPYLFEFHSLDMETWSGHATVGRFDDGRGWANNFLCLISNRDCTRGEQGADSDRSRYNPGMLCISLAGSTGPLRVRHGEVDEGCTSAVFSSLVHLICSLWS